MSHLSNQGHTFLHLLKHLFTTYFQYHTAKVSEFSEGDYFRSCPLCRHISVSSLSGWEVSKVYSADGTLFRNFFLRVSEQDSQELTVYRLLRLVF